MLASKPVYKYLADIVFPNTCAFCGNVIKWDNILCEKCAEDIPDTFEGLIRIENTDGAVGVFYYESDIIGLIYKLKHGDAVFNFAELSAGMIAERLLARKIADSIDIVTAVPMHISKKIIRGRDQAELLGRFVADKLGKPTNFHLLGRKKDSTEQHKLEREERQSHAEEVYTALPKHRDISGKTVLICDDVITTGSTIRACAAQLKSMGAKKVYACSAAVSAVYKDRGDDILP
ncbi:ComF family protein [Ruminococcus albus]|uniref:Competence protein ComFC n=1 Tax=Ruminococcus albus TaxID=1264 RepID=A0A1I1DU31_RUMAL|nr:phosphoribosyltransferase domain-containing protein [Ruminococcus albus]SFB78307.1 competence protein ComFC [Ruminococcus albus]